MAELMEADVVAIPVFQIFHSLRLQFLVEIGWRLVGGNLGGGQENSSGQFLFCLQLFKIRRERFLKADKKRPATAHGMK
jgi:hypothetical protein